MGGQRGICGRRCHHPRAAACAKPRPPGSTGVSRRGHRISFPLAPRGWAGHHLLTSAPGCYRREPHRSPRPLLRCRIQPRSASSSCHLDRGSTRVGACHRQSPPAPWGPSPTVAPRRWWIRPQGHRIHTRRCRIRPPSPAPPRAAPTTNEAAAVIASRSEFRRPARAAAR